MSTPEERLKQERQRLGYSQEAFARLGGVQKRTQINYEKGERKPDTKYLEGIAAAGADVDFILTGTPRVLRESLNDVRTASELGAALGGTREDVRRNQAEIFEGLRKARTERADEEELLSDYRQCTPDDRTVIRQMAARFAKHAPRNIPNKRRQS